MSVMALSSKVAAPSSSFLVQDKTLSQSDTHSAYQGTNGSTAVPSKIEASGASEPASTGTTVALVRPAPIVSLASNTGTSLASSPNTANLHANSGASASFSLLTGPRAITGVREGQIAAPLSTAALSVVASRALTPSFVEPISQRTSRPSTSHHVPSIGTGISSGILTQPSVAPNRVPDVPSLSHEHVGGRVGNVAPPLAAVFEPVTLINQDIRGAEPSNPLNPASASPHTNTVDDVSVQEQFALIFGETNKPTPVEEPARDPVQDQRKHALAEIFAREEDAQVVSQARQDAVEKQQAVDEKQEPAEQSEPQEQVTKDQAQQQVDALKIRDAEVKAHEHAHATVGGQYAQSPSFTYEKGADGQRYVTDGEVQIDVSPIAGDPLATINKMKQVYAAAMAPVDPSAADIRVAAEALKKMNEAKVLLAEERQQQIVDLQTIQTLIGADAQIKELPPLQERVFSVTGEVDESGNVSQPQDKIITPTSEAIDKIKQALAPQIAYIAEPQEKTAIVSDTVSDQTETNIAPPTATLAAATSFLATLASRPASVATRYYSAVAQSAVSPSTLVTSQFAPQFNRTQSLDFSV